MSNSQIYGFSDWKIPGRSELFTLISHEYCNPVLPQGHPFINIFSGYTTSVLNPQYAWVLYTNDGAVGGGFKVKPEFYLWPLRKHSI